MHKLLRISPKLMAVSVAGLFAVAVLLLTASAVPATDRIVFFDVFERYFVTWSPPSVTTTIAPGETQTLPLSLTTHRPLRNVVVYVPPALRPFVQVAPEEFPLIEADTAVSLNLTLSAPADTVPGTIKGTLRLFSAMRIGGLRILFMPMVFAKPLPVGVVMEEPSTTVFGELVVQPLTITADVSTIIFAEIFIPEPELVSQSIRLNRLDENGRIITTLGNFHDDGLGGDVKSGDKRFGVEVTLNEPAPGLVRLQATAAFSNAQKRLISTEQRMSVLKPVADTGPEALIQTVSATFFSASDVSELSPFFDGESFQQIQEVIAHGVPLETFGRVFQTARLQSKTANSARFTVFITRGDEVFGATIVLQKFAEGWKIVDF